MYRVAAGQVAEWNFASSKVYNDPYNEVELDVVFTTPDGDEFAVPAFWRGGGRWSVRFSGRSPGVYRWRSVCSDATNAGLHHQAGEIEVVAAPAPGVLGERGRLRVSADKTYFEHEDGTPFFWLADTWWMAFSSRLDWPHGFKELAADRVAKGFNVIQLVAGPFPDMPPFDPRNHNEAGYPFEGDFAAVNPAFYELADLKIAHLVSVGLMPCIVGMWGYYLPFMGVEKVKRFWRYLIARYAAYPVVWCLAGEGTMPWYLSETPEEDRKLQLEGWTEVMWYVRRLDPYHNLISIHPSNSGRDTVADDSGLDFEMLQTGHGDMESVVNVLKSVRAAVERKPRMPVVNAEVNYEGIMGRSFENVQRLCCWHSLINGTAGHTYGANGIWQVNLPGKPFGPSPHGNSWGDTPWRDAMQLSGSRQVGLAAQLWRRFKFWEFERHPEWLAPEQSAEVWHCATCTGIPRRIRVCYLPFTWSPPVIRALEPDVKYRAWYWDTRTGKVTDLGSVKPDNEGNWQAPKSPSVQDWLLVLEAE